MGASRGTRSTRTCRADSWDEFVAMVQGYRKKDSRRMVEDLVVDARLGMIVRLAEDWCERSSVRRAEIEARTLPLRQARAESMRLRVENLRAYVDDATRRTMPRVHRRQNTTEQRRKITARAGNFFRGWEHASPGRIERARRRCENPRLRMLEDPYGGPVPEERVQALLTSIRECCPPTVRKRSVVEPAGMTPERALQIAVSVLR